MFNLKNQRFGILIIALSLGVMISCGDSTEDPPPGETHTIGGTVDNLQGPVNVKLCTGDDLDPDTNICPELVEVLELTADGAFEFVNELEEDSKYNVVLGPAIGGDSFNSNCPLAPDPVFINASGEVQGNVTNIRIECN